MQLFAPCIDLHVLSKARRIFQGKIDSASMFHMAVFLAQCLWSFYRGIANYMVLSYWFFTGAESLFFVFSLPFIQM
jgi:hypothetical protein